MKYSTLVASLILATTLPVTAYWDFAHKDFAQYATETATINSAPLKNYYSNRLGFDMEVSYPVDNKKDAENDRILNDKKIWSKIVREGASDEDYPLSRPLNHFFDPVNNHSLYQTLNQRNWKVTTSIADLFSSSTTNPNWALEDSGSIPQQNYSLKDSNDLLYKALTEKANTRSIALGEHFYALAHVLHLLADMGQPEHVRNDSHLPIGVQNSLYEKYTDELIENNRLNLIELYNNNPYQIDNSNFKNSRQFWTSNGIELSDFSKL